MWLHIHAYVYTYDSNNNNNNININNRNNFLYSISHMFRAFSWANTGRDGSLKTTTKV